MPGVPQGGPYLQSQGSGGLLPGATDPAGYMWNASGSEHSVRGGGMGALAVGLQRTPFSAASHFVPETSRNMRWQLS
jgi:hypothetical protein